LRARLNRGWDAEKALFTPAADTENLISYKGRTQSLTDWSKEIGLSKSSLQKRFAAGWSIEKALSTPVSDGSRHCITYRGCTKPATAWAKEVGMQLTTLLNRLKAGWTVERALETPVRKQKKRTPKVPDNVHQLDRKPVHNNEAAVSDDEAA
jgi:hypothetical protein